MIYFVNFCQIRKSDSHDTIIQMSLMAKSLTLSLTLVIYVSLLSQMRMYIYFFPADLCNVKSMAALHECIGLNYFFPLRHINRLSFCYKQ